MPYSDFTLVSVEHAFELRRHEVSGLFVDVLPCAPTPRLEDAIAEGVPLAGAINTAKARSELLIMPVLLDVRRHFPGQVSLFSGVLFDVDPSRGLTGYCDFLLSRGPSQMVLTVPVAVVVEAKNENLMSGLVLQLCFWACPPFVVPILGDALMPAAPRRPSQNPFHFLLRGQYKTPEETTNLADTQRHASPRVALNAAKLLGWEGRSVFFGSSGDKWAARSTVNSAYAHIAKVICRYHPVQLRIS